VTELLTEHLGHIAQLNVKQT